MNEFVLADGCSYFTTNGQYWCQSIRIYCLDSIASHLSNNLVLTPIIALSYFLSSQQRSIISLDEHEDSELRNIYKIAYRVFSQFTDTEASLTDLVNGVIDKTNMQFGKSMACAEDNSSLPLSKIKAYASNGIDFSEKRRKLYFSKDEIVVTLVEVAESADLHFVKKFKNNLNGKEINWSDCYTSGKKEGLFQIFGSHLSVKDACHYGGTYSYQLRRIAKK